MAVTPQKTSTSQTFQLTCQCRSKASPILPRQTLHVFGRCCAQNWGEKHQSQLLPQRSCISPAQGSPPTPGLHKVLAFYQGWTSNSISPAVSGHTAPVFCHQFPDPSRRKLSLTDAKHLLLSSLLYPFFPHHCSLSEFLFLLIACGFFQAADWNVYHFSSNSVTLPFRLFLQQAPPILFPVWWLNASSGFLHNTS